MEDEARFIFVTDEGQTLDSEGFVVFNQQIVFCVDAVYIEDAWKAYDKAMEDKRNGKWDKDKLQVWIVKDTIWEI